MIAFLVGLFLILPLAVLALSLLFKRQLAASGRVFVIHSSRPLPLEISSISLGQLQEFLDQACRLGVEFVPATQMLQNATQASITADDGYDDLLQVWPLLRDRGVPLTVFIPTAFIGRSNQWDTFLTEARRRHLTDTQIRSLAEEGVQFGSHGHTHRDLTSLSDAEVRRELESSRRILERLTARPIQCLAYPYGKVDQRVMRLAAAGGYTDGFLSGPGSSGPLTRGRIPLGRLDNSLSFSSKLQPDPLSGAEYLKVLIISAFSRLAPAAARLKQSSASPIRSD